MPSTYCCALKPHPCISSQQEVKLKSIKSISSCSLWWCKHVRRRRQIGQMNASQVCDTGAASWESLVSGERLCKHSNLSYRPCIWDTCSDCDAVLPSDWAALICIQLHAVTQSF